MDSGSGEVVTSPTPAKVASGDGEQQPRCLGLAVVGGILYSILSPKASPDVPRLANPVQLTSAIGVEDYPTWSADGGRLAYQSQQSGNGDIWVTQPGGGQPVNRTAGHTGRDCCPSWSPDGSQIAFWSDRDGGGYFVMSALGGAARKVISSQRFSSPPQWSADGEELAGLVTDGFVEIVSMRTRESRRLAVPSEMTAVMDLVPQPVTVGIGMRRAVFSPDGTKLAYSRGRRVANLWRVPIFEDRPATWADAQQLTFDEAYIERVDLSPDAERLLVQSDRSGNMDLWVLPRDGGEWMQVTSEPTPDWYPRWSPNGQDIAFFSYRTGNREIWVMPVSGGPAHQLTDGQATNTESWLPAWSPDGREIAFSSSPAASIYVMPSDGGKARQVTKRPEQDFFPIGLRTGNGSSSQLRTVCGECPPQAAIPSP